MSNGSPMALAPTPAASASTGTNRFFCLDPANGKSHREALLVVIVAVVKMTMERINAVGNVWEGVGEPAGIAPQKVRKIPRRGCSRWCGW